MPKKLWCKKCGKELVHKREAVKGKGLILDLVEPHECEGYSVRSNKDEKPTVQDILDNLKDLDKTISDSSKRSKDANLVVGLEDKRDDKRTSTAPESLLRDFHTEPVK